MNHLIAFSMGMILGAMMIAAIGLFSWILGKCAIPTDANYMVAAVFGVAFGGVSVFAVLVKLI